MDINCHEYVNKCIGTTHTYTWKLLRGNPSLTPPSGIPLLPPLHTNIIHYIILKTLQKLPNLIMIKPPQSMSTNQLIYHFWNQITPQSLYPTPNTFNLIRKCSNREGFPWRKELSQLHPIDDSVLIFKWYHWGDSK